MKQNLVDAAGVLSALTSQQYNKLGTIINERLSRTLMPHEFVGELGISYEDGLKILKTLKENGCCSTAVVFYHAICYEDAPVGIQLTDIGSYRQPEVCPNCFQEVEPKELRVDWLALNLQPLSREVQK